MSPDRVKTPRPTESKPAPPATPAVLETSKVALPPVVLELAERLAVNGHHAWVRQKLDEGWHHGPRQDGLRKEHPFLVAYDQLPPEQQQLRRDLVVETLKGVYALNHEIVAGHETAQDNGEPVADKEVTALLQSIARNKKDLAGLLALWKERAQAPVREVWSRTPLPYRRLAERLLGVS